MPSGPSRKGGRRFSRSCARDVHSASAERDPLLPSRPCRMAACAPGPEQCPWADNGCAFKNRRDHGKPRRPRGSFWLPGEATARFLHPPPRRSDDSEDDELGRLHQHVKTAGHPCLTRRVHHPGETISFPRGLNSLPLDPRSNTCLHSAATGCGRAQGPVFVPMLSGWVEALPCGKLLPSGAEPLLAGDPGTALPGTAFKS